MTLPRQRRLVFENRAVFTPVMPKHGERPRTWKSPDSPNFSGRGLDNYDVEVAVVGVDISGGGVKSPVFDTELLADGYTKRARYNALKAALRAEVERLDGSDVENIALSAALIEMTPLLLRLHEHGYTIEDLRRLVIGSLRVSLTDEELTNVMFG